MSKTEWAGLLLVAGFVLWVIMDRFDGLGRALHDLKIEVVGHRSIQHTVRYTELAPDRFKNFWRD
jgi:hypothetical protein